jgi:hypothetical protein
MIPVQLPGRRHPIHLTLALLLAGSFSAGCESTPEIEGTTVLDLRGCDPISPTMCGMPFPSSVYLVADPAMVTGYHVYLPPTVVPPSTTGAVSDTSLFLRSDGFSPGSDAIVHLPGATKAGLPDPDHIADSLAADSPTILLDATTNTRVAHWAEIDQRSQPEGTPEEDTFENPKALLIRPVKRLEDAHRYIVAVRHVRDSAGNLIAPSPVFRALRDGQGSRLSTVLMRRAQYADIFAKLEAAGIPRSDLQIAWDYTTASQANNTRWLLAMRDRAFAELGDGASPYVIDSVDQNPSEHIALRIKGRITVPLYLDSNMPGARMSFGADGMPVQHGTGEFPFTVAIPKSAAAGAKDLMHVGHGLFGAQNIVDDSRLTLLADQEGFVLLALDWLGLSSPDLAILGNELLTGDLSRFATVPERGMQAMLNNLLALRMVRRALAKDPATFLDGHATISTDKVYYWGASLGGIYGSTYMALTTDIQRGVLGVPGQGFNLMLPRSRLYDNFLLAIGLAFDKDARPLFPVFLSFAQMLWDRVDPTGFTQHIITDPLPGTPTHQVFIISSVGDQQVPNVSTHLMARTIGLPQLAPAYRPIYGLETMTGPITGSALLEIDFGLPPVPLVNLPNRQGTDPHDGPWGLPKVHEMMGRFLRTGEIVNLCDGVCNPD